MGMTFNAFEIFEMAEQIERNGIMFYQKAAQCVSSAKSRQVLTMLAEKEKGHEEIFAEMRKQLSEKDSDLRAFDPENEMSLYLQALASGHIFDLDKDLSEELSTDAGIENIRTIAIGAEKDSIVFYLGMKEFVPNAAGKDKVDHIIREEMKHIAMLNRELAD